MSPYLTVQAERRQRLERCIVAGVLGVVLAPGCGPLGEVRGADPPNRPPTVRLYGLMDRMSPETTYTEGELRVIARRYEVITGLDGHGYNFPGVIGRVKAIYPGITVLCSWDTMGVQSTSPRFEEFDPREDVFIHSADPASLRIVQHQGQAIGWFRQDGRVAAESPYHVAFGVTEYLVEYTDQAGGGEVFTPLGDPIAESAALHYLFTDELHPQRRYRVRTRLGNGELVQYSDVAGVEPAAAAVLAAAALSPSPARGMLGFTHDLRPSPAGGLQVRERSALQRAFKSIGRRGRRRSPRSGEEALQAMVVCYGAECPAEPGGVVLELDADNDRSFGESAAEPAERWPMQTAEDLSDGARLYTALLRPAPPGLFGYRAIIDGRPDSVCPPEGSYQRSGYNNRLRNPMHSSFLVWPDHPYWLEKVHERFNACLANGYDGMRLDFSFDTLEPEWVSSGLPPGWGPALESRITDGVTRLYAGLKTAAPQAKVTFNGYFMQSREHYFERLAGVDGADFEYFAFGVVEGSSQPDARTADALRGVLETRLRGKWAMVVAGREEANLAARLQSLVLYLLVADEGVFYFYATCCFSADVAYFPEWDVPLGAARTRVRDVAELRDERQPALLTRSYAFGTVYYNEGDQPIEVPLEQTRYQLFITGGKIPALGGNGAVQYHPVEKLNLPPRSGAILLHQRPG